MSYLYSPIECLWQIRILKTNNTQIIQMTVISANNDKTTPIAHRCLLGPVGENHYLVITDKYNYINFIVRKLPAVIVFKLITVAI